MKKSLFYLLLHILCSCVPLFCNSPSIVYVYTGNPPPPCAYTVFKQARYMNESCDIYLLTDHKNYEVLNNTKKTFFKKHNIIVLDTSLIPPSKEHTLFRQISPFDKEFKGGFWQHATERFFYLQDFLHHSKLEDVVHMETDVMLYTDLEELLPIFLENNIDLAGPFQWLGECVPGIIYIKNMNTWDSYINHIIQSLYLRNKGNSNVELNDMRTLASFYHATPLTYINLPILMKNYEKFFPKRYVEKDKNQTPLSFLSKYCDLFPGFLFDAAAFGIYANGYDRSVYANGNAGDIHWKSLFDPSNLSYYWGKDNSGRRVPYVQFKNQSYRIVNLHFHSKHPEMFTSYNQEVNNFPS